MATLLNPDLAGLTWKLTIFLSAAIVLELILWRRAASLRHLVWSAALVGALAIPVLSAALPHWTIPVWDDLVPSSGASLFRVDAYDRAEVQTGQAAARALPVLNSQKRVSSDALPWPMLLWLAGSLAVTLQTLAGAFVVVRLRRKAGPVPEGIGLLARDLAGELGVDQSVHVLATSATTTPMTWGVFRPVILLPESVVKGDPKRLRAVLLHELAHVGRRDFLLHLVGQAACAVYWFHPLVWLARRRALGLREKASDDLVLAHGVKPSDYALSLLQLSRALSAPRLCGSLGICRTSNLEKRVRAILDARLRRGRLTPVAAVVTIAATAVLLAVVGAAHPALAQIPRLGVLPLASVVPPSFAFARQAESVPDLESIEADAATAAAAFDLDKAATLYRKAADIKRSRFGAQSTQYALDLIRLGALYRSWDRLEDAHVFYADALSILETTLGRNYPGLAKPLYFLAMEAHLNGDLNTAETLYRRVVDLLEQPASPETALAKRALAVIAKARGESTAEGLPEIPAPAVSSSADLSSGSQAFSAGGDVTAPKLLSKVEPQYSREARLVKFQGTVILRAVIERDGSVHEVAVRRSLGLGLDAKAVEALRQWRFQPGTKDGEPVRVQAQVEVNFRLM